MSGQRRIITSVMQGTSESAINKALNNSNEVVAKESNKGKKEKKSKKK